MNILHTKLKNVIIIEPRIHGDNRGWFFETYSQTMFEQCGIKEIFVQDNHSFTSQKGTLRGIHYQNDPMSQAKIVRVVSGIILDIVVDLRKGSPFYKQWVSIELSTENKRMVYIPRGFGHAFLTLTPDVEFVYKVDNLYSPAHDRSIRYDDPALSIDWGVSSPILSAKDAGAPLLADSDCNFIYSEVI